MGAIRHRAPVSRADVGRLTKISPASVSAIVADLIEEGLVREEGHSPAELGRPGRLLRFADGLLYLGCDLASAEGMRVGLMRLTGELIESAMLPWPARGMSPERVTRTISDYLIDATHRHMPARIVAAGIGVPGIIEQPDGFIRTAPLLGWADVDLGEIVHARLSIPVVIDNDVKLALAAEVDQGAAADARYVVFLAFAEGIGGAVLVDGKIYRGRGSAGEVGYIVTDAAGSAGAYQEVGFFENRIYELIAEEAKREGINTADYDEQTARLIHLMHASRGSLTFSAETETEFTRTIAAALASAVALLDPEVVLLSGWIELAGERLIGRIVDELGRLVPSVPEVRLAAVGPNAVVIGGALAACQNSLAGVQVVEARI